MTRRRSAEVEPGIEPEGRGGRRQLLRHAGGSAACVGIALLWVLILVAAKVYDGGSRLGAALLLLAGFLVGWLAGAMLGGGARRDATAPGYAAHETEDAL